MTLPIETRPRCKVCGKVIYNHPHKNGKPRSYCSNACYKAAYPETQRTETICQFCGKPFTERRGITNLYCSISCSQKAQLQRKAYWKQQDEAEELAYNKEVEELRAELLEKYTALIQEAEQLRIRIEREIPCKECGQIFWSEHGSKFCSEGCRKRHDNRRKDKRIYRNGRPDLSITLTKVYMRDGGICQICGKEINFDCDSNSDDYPSIDHIVPLAKGGLHKWNNVQLACRGCNTAKGIRIHPHLSISS